ncbi:hypothetical protein LCGC14_0920810 [marine sediment metagenome]|uniref:Uncharacterized protein n=1 Tax=marine sediment metagenome TaxID=412755 RepID=A0A0F9NR05_9ZZZZ
MFAPNRLAQLCCCCCGGAKGIVSGTVLGTAIPPFTAEETQILEKIARGTYRDTGRKCIDFFATLLSGEFQDAIVAARPTLLIKLTGLDDVGLNAANSTLCGRIPELLKPSVTSKPKPRIEPPSTGTCPFITQSRRGPQAFRSSRGFGCHESLAEAVAGMRLIIKNNPGTSARVIDRATGIIVERINE